ncbi:uncharacterized protein UDID_18765 [Ustilago sp. UG-2017a]|nr:uncharacterized protein UDID_18765 [Ustilago sp. UG-2017a]
MALYLFTVVPAPLLLLSLQRVPAASSDSQESSTRPLILIALSRLSFLSRADSIDTAPPRRFLLHSPPSFDRGAGPYARRARHEEDQAQGAGAAMKRTKLKEQAQPRRGPSSRSMQMVTTQGLER